MNTQDNKFLGDSTSLRQAFDELHEVLISENIVASYGKNSSLGQSLDKLSYVIGNHDDFFNSLSRVIGVLALADLDFAEDELVKLYGRCEIGDAIAGGLDMFVRLLQRGQRIYTADFIVKTFLKPNTCLMIEDALGRIAYVNHNFTTEYHKKFTGELKIAPGDTVESLLLIPDTSIENNSSDNKSQEQTFSGFIKFFTDLVPCAITRKKFQKTEQLYLIEINNFSNN